MKIKHMSTDRVKTALRFMFNATGRSARNDFNNNNVYDVNIRHCLEHYINRQTDEKKIFLQGNALS